MSLASFAKNLLGATPTDAVRPVSFFMASLIFSPIATPDPNSFSEPVTSRNASSTESGSTSGVKRSKIPKTCRETSF